jgi:2',3'-cyclic-nucleotide 2'-phosphodiesterase (5'-nucleotidase family)
MRLRHALAAALGCALIGAPAASAKPTVHVQVVGINDFHGNLEPPAAS